MKRSVQSLFVAALICVGGSFCLGQQVDNPQYKSWAKFKPGTAVTMKTDAAGTTIETTTTLVEVTPEKVVVESKMKMAGMEGMDMPATKMDIPAKVAQAAGGTATGPAPVTKDEEVEVAGKKYKTKVTETKSGDTVSKTWTSDEVPGMMVKMESGTTKMALSAITIK